MSEESRGVSDPAVEYIATRKDEIIDFIFRLTADPGRAALLAQETCVQIGDELPSQASFESIRKLLFQRAYDLNEEALRPMDRNFLERYFRNHFQDRQQLALVYRWELTLLEIGQFAALLLLLLYRFGFSVEDAAEILGRDLASVRSERASLEKNLKKQQKADWESLRLLPRYGFVIEQTDGETPLSAMMRDMKDRDDDPSYRRRGLLVILVGIVLVVFVSCLTYRSRRGRSNPRKKKP